LIRSEWEKLPTFEPFSFRFLNEIFNEQYQQQERLGYLSAFFSTVAVIIAILGLFSLSAFMIRRRRKEIGIRKILGASVSQLVLLLSSKFLLLVLLALVISFPLVLSSSKSFLNDFAYQIEIGWSLFAYVAAGALLCAFISVSFQAIRTSLSNPVDEIKDE
ncbi:MAG: FtsX-like permease family protein, partial [Cyclobacteriaceae bacterium]